MTRTIVRTATVALAIAALAAPTALARPDSAVRTAPSAAHAPRAPGRRPVRDAPDPRPQPAAARPGVLAARDRLGRIRRPRHRLGDDRHRHRRQPARRRRHRPHHHPHPPSAHRRLTTQGRSASEGGSHPPSEVQTAPFGDQLLTGIGSRAPPNGRHGDPPSGSGRGLPRWSRLPVGRREATGVAGDAGASGQRAGLGRSADRGAVGRAAAGDGAQAGAGARLPAAQAARGRRRGDRHARARLRAARRTPTPSTRCASSAC